MYSKSEQRKLFDLSKQLLKTLLAIDINLAKQQAKDLQKVLSYHEWKYYVQDEPAISDYEYDQLYKKLEALEKAFPVLITPSSPTQRVANDLTASFPTVEHLVPMLSLDNSYNAEDLNDFDARIKKLGELDEETAIAYCVEPKFDGGSIALIYENDKLHRAATRGNGTLGEEMTNNARVIRSIPLSANFSKHGIYKVELRGEVLIRKDRFIHINNKRAAAGDTLFANPRNAATGGLRMKDAKKVEERSLDAFLYQLGYAINEQEENLLTQFKTHNEGIEMLHNIGFKVPISERKVCKNIQEVIDFCKSWEAKREDYEYEIDGMVVKVNDLELQEKCGYTSHHPRWAIAYKFQAKQATTRLLDIEYQVGKIGNITPVAKVEAVQLAGVTVTSISLHNEDFIKNKDLRIGDQVLIERAGDVIPQIVKSIKDVRDGSEKAITFPMDCPSCQTTLIRVEGEAAWRCDNIACTAQILRRLEHHVSKHAMDIDGFGTSYIERFYQLGFIKGIADIYRLDYEKIAVLEGFGEKSAQNLKVAIETAKKNPIQRLLHSLSIQFVGRTVSKVLVAEVTKIQDLRNLTKEQLELIPDIGPKVAEQIWNFFQKAENIALLDELESLGVNTLQTEADKPEVVNTDGVFGGKTILFTGKLQEVSRSEAQDLAKKAGAKVVSGVSSKLNILVVGKKAGSKLKKAQVLDSIEIMSEQTFIELINTSSKIL